MPAAASNFPKLFFQQVEHRKDRVAPQAQRIRYMETNILERIRAAGGGSGAGLIALGSSLAIACHTGR